jgi:hypothetical protein
MKFLSPLSGTLQQDLHHLVVFWEMDVWAMFLAMTVTCSEYIPGGTRASH